VQKYIERRFVKGDEEVDPWSLSPLQDVEMAVLEIEIEKPRDCEDCNSKE
jgi:hypothetical protein